jgi:hypothetical protein
MVPAVWMRQALATIPKSEQYALLRPLTNKHLVIEARLSFDPTLDARLSVLEALSPAPSRTAASASTGSGGPGRSPRGSRSDANGDRDVRPGPICLSLEPAEVDGRDRQR